MHASIPGHYELLSAFCASLKVGFGCLEPLRFVPVPERASPALHSGSYEEHHDAIAGHSRRQPSQSGLLFVQRHHLPVGGHSKQRNFILAANHSSWQFLWTWPQSHEQIVTTAVSPSTILPGT